MKRQLEYIKIHAKWLVAVTIAVTILFLIIIGDLLKQKKNNYTELWRRVDEIERDCCGKYN